MLFNPVVKLGESKKFAAHYKNLMLLTENRGKLTT